MKHYLLKLIKFTLIITIFITLQSCQDVIIDDIEFEQLQILRDGIKHDTFLIKLDTITYKKCKE